MTKIVILLLVVSSMLCGCKVKNGPVAEIKSTHISQASNEPNRLSTVADFGDTMLCGWSWGGAKASFTRQGEYKGAFVRLVDDPERGKVGEINFPESVSKSKRELNLIMRRDPLIKRISFWAKGQEKGSYIDLSIYSNKRKCHYSVRVPLSARWQKYHFDLNDFKCLEVPGDPLKAVYIDNLQFIADSGKESVFYVDDIITESNSRQQKKTLLRRPVNAPWCFKYGKTTRLKYQLAARGNVAIRSELYKYDGKKLREKAIKPEVKPGLNSIHVDFDDLAPGYYNLKLFVGEKDDTSVPLNDYFMVCHYPEPNQYDTPIELNLSSIFISKQLLLDIAHAGIQRVRVWDFTWPEVEPVEGMENFARLDQIAKWADEAKLKLLPVLQHSPPWAIHVPTEIPAPWVARYLKTRPPADINKWYNFVYKTVNRYKDSIKEWEIWNEPDWQSKAHACYFWGNTGQYFRVLKTAYTAAKKADPGCTIISGGISMNPRYTDLSFTEKLIGHSGTAYMDGYGFHAYESLPTCKKQIAIAKSAKSGLSLWQTEVGAKGPATEGAASKKAIAHFMKHCFNFLTEGVRHYSFHRANFKTFDSPLLITSDFTHQIHFDASNTVFS